MASIRLFILSSFDALGPMHGHRLRVEAERNHVTLWTDVSVGAVYGAMKRLASEGLLQEAGREREGRRPTRQLYEITDAGRGALATLRREGLSEVWFRFDPFDLALTRMDAAVRDDLPDLLARRLDAVRELLAERRRLNEQACPHVGLAKQWALRHSEYRLEAEVAYLSDLLEQIENVTADEPGGRPSEPASRRHQ